MRHEQALIQANSKSLLHAYPQLVHIDLQFLNVRGGQHKKRGLLEEIVKTQVRGGKFAAR
jgi:hypothetical protein